MAIGIDAITPMQQIRLKKATAVTDAQIAIAMELSKKYFRDATLPQVAAILQALATNYVATVAASKD